MKRLLPLCIAACMMAAAPVQGAPGIEEALVQVIVSFQENDPFVPWRKRQPGNRRRQQQNGQHPHHQFCRSGLQLQQPPVRCLRGLSILLRHRAPPKGRDAINIAHSQGWRY